MVLSSVSTFTRLVLLKLFGTTKLCFLQKVAGNANALRDLADDLILRAKLMHELLNKDGMDASEMTIIQALAK